MCCYLDVAVGIVDIIEGPGPVQGGGDKVVAGGMQRGTGDLGRVVCECGTWGPGPGRPLAAG